MDKKTLRNISLFVVVALASGWLGLLIDRSISPQADQESPGMGIWLILPLLTTIILRLFMGDGWKDIGLKPYFKANIKWYFISLIIFPLVTISILVMGKIFGWISFSNFKTNAYIAGFTSTIGVNFVKNIFEEFVWRGYLTTKLLNLKTKDIWLYLIVGGVWGAWHLPYYLFFLPASDMHQVLAVDRLVFALVSIISMLCWTIMFIELYRITKSIWPVVLLHMMEDSVVNHLVLDGHISITANTEILISPIVGFITSIFYLIIGLQLRRYRRMKENHSLIGTPAAKIT